jgi:hypothetical protein
LAVQAVPNICAIGVTKELKFMALIRKKNPSYLVKHRRKWQVKLVIPRDVRWAFDNKTTFKRSTGCNLRDTQQAVIERDRIVSKFKKNVELHRVGTGGTRKDANQREQKFSNTPVPMDYRTRKKTEELKEETPKSDVDGWIKERLLNKGKNTKVLRYDFWNIDKKKV